MGDVLEYFPAREGVDMSKLMIHCVAKYSISKPTDAAGILAVMKEFLDLTFRCASQEHRPINIMDATACVGGDTISFAEYFPKVIAVEKDEKTFRMLENNLDVYRLKDRVLPIHADFVELLRGNNIPASVDAVYIDPPWNPPGQPWHSKLKNLMLSLSNVPIHTVVHDIIKKTHIRTVVLKVPFNFDFRAFLTKIPRMMVMTHRVSSFFIVMCWTPSANKRSSHDVQSAVSQPSQTTST